MTSLFDQLSALLRSGDWPMEQVPGQPILSVTYQAADGEQWVLVAAADDDTRMLTLFARAPEACPPDRSAPVMEFFNRANFSMTHGAWAMDLADGEIRFRAGVDVSGRDLTGTELSAATNYVNAVMQASLAPLRSVLTGTATPAAAHEAIYT